ncbi:MAG TPA: hypothetical protein VN446_00890 [Candidatus Acidoferrum sp.]|nr:hypothetical protein [Candidatus Acidoferrum sp.]
MKKKAGGVLSIAVALALVFSLATPALACSNFGGKGNSSNRNASGKAKTMSTQNYSSKGGFSGKTTKTGGYGFGGFTYPNAWGQFNSNAWGQFNYANSWSFKCLTNFDLGEAIEALSDEDKETLEDEIEAYEEAVAEEKEAKEEAKEKLEALPEYYLAIMTALSDLFEAAGDADIDLYSAMWGPGSKSSPFYCGWNGKNYTDPVEAAIDALSDEDKETLEDEIEAYEDAVAAANEAREEAEKNNELSSYRKAVEKAAKELVEAAKEADIDLWSKKSSTKKDLGLGDWIGASFAEAVEKALDELDDEDKETLEDEIEDFEEAIAAAREAVEDADEDDELTDYYTAIMNALTALLEAAKEADIDLELMKS